MIVGKVVNKLYGFKVFLSEKVQFFLPVPLAHTSPSRIRIEFEKDSFWIRFQILINKTNQNQYFFILLNKAAPAAADHLYNHNP